MLKSFSGANFENIASDLADDFERYGEDLSESAWEVASDAFPIVCEAYGAGECAIVVVIPIGHDGRQQEYICIPDALWGSIIFDHSSSEIESNIVAIDVEVRLQFECVLAGSGYFQESSQQVIPSKMICASPPGFKPFQGWRDLCRDVSAPSFFIPQGVEVIGISRGREIGLGAVIYTYNAGRSSITSLVEKVSALSKAVNEASFDSGRNSWKSKFVMLMSGVTIYIDERNNRCRLHKFA